MRHPQPAALVVRQADCPLGEFQCETVSARTLFVLSVYYMTCRLRHVVVDEADLLLGGGYAKALWQVIDWMRTGDKDRKIEALCQAVGASPARFHSLPYNIRKQALEGALLSEASAV